MEILNKVKIKPLSVNKAWKGRRFRTDEYKAYKEHLMLILPKNIVVPAEGKIMLTLVFGFSNEASDCGNPLKLFEDILCVKYGFNDNRVYAHRLVKIVVPKGEEFIAFSIESISEEDYEKSLKEVLALIR